MLFLHFLAIFFFLNGLFRLNLGVPRLHCLVLLAVCNVYLCRLVDVLKELYGRVKRKRGQAGKEGGREGE